MSIATSIEKLSETLTNCKENLKEKQVENVDSIKISDVDEKIAEIKAGGGSDLLHDECMSIDKNDVGIKVYDVMEGPQTDTFTLTINAEKLDDGSYDLTMLKSENLEIIECSEENFKSYAAIDFDKEKHANIDFTIKANVTDQQFLGFLLSHLSTDPFNPGNKANFIVARLRRR